MRYMLDTCTFLWLVTEDHGNLNPRIVEIFLDNENEIVFSVVSAWEISIKSSIGKLDLKLPARDFLEAQISQNGLSLLPVSLDHVVKVAELPFHHKDPFDRLLIAQAMVESLPIMSADGIFDNYDVDVIS